MIQPKPLKHRKDNDCPDCMFVAGRFNSFGQFYCETCDSLYELTKPKTTRQCYKCEGTGKLNHEKMRQICCEKPLEIGLCCQMYILDIEKTPYKCDSCDGIGTRKRKTSCTEDRF